MTCPFCTVDSARLFHVGELVLGLWDKFPVTPGHVLLVTKRHVASWFDATPDERAEMIAGIETAKAAIEARRFAADGYNIGVNVGETAGQTVPHLHLHVIPRVKGDTPDPRGGVRLCVPSAGNYLVTKSASSRAAMSGSPPHAHQLITGSSADPLLPHLLAHLGGTSQLDIAVAFVMPAGVNAISEHLADLLDRGGTLRLLTGDYLEATDPDALLQLLDFAAQHPEQVHLRAYEARQRAFHPKTYILRSTDDGIAFVGSSNLSASALTRGVEWNFRIVSSDDRPAFSRLLGKFDELFEHPATKPLTQEWIDAYRIRRPVRYAPPASTISMAADGPEVEAVDEAEQEPLSPAKPHKIQSEALEALELTRQEGNRAGLVVMATGLGKTWLSAFDATRPEFGRVLFVAHREEILRQAMRTYRRVRPDARLGLYTGDEKSPDADVLFASIQTLSRPEHLNLFEPTTFDYITVDEFHHAYASTYGRLLDHFDPRFLLGLTATPERTDGGDLLAFCGENLVYRANLPEGIERGFLSRFRYYGVSDDVDYEKIPWRSGRFREAELEAKIATKKRADNAYEQLQRFGGERTIAFCASVRHAVFMRDYFRDKGLRVAAVHSESDSDPRTASLELLAAGELDVVVSVDMFNEGVDVPLVDTVLMLRPTQSKLLWMQQIGRGLRKADGKDHLRIIDYVGNHRTFLTAVQALFGLDANVLSLRAQVAALRANGGLAELPGGCHVTYDLEAIDLLEQLTRTTKKGDAFEEWANAFVERHERRPSAVEAYHAGFDPKALPKSLGTWFSALKRVSVLSSAEKSALNAEELSDWLAVVQKTSMERSYKMVLLLAWIDVGFPSPANLDALTRAFQKRAQRAGSLAMDISADLNDLDELGRLLLKNPINAWTGKGSGAGGFVALHGNELRFTTSLSADVTPTLRELTRELAEWRLADYLHRRRQDRIQAITADSGEELDAHFRARSEIT